MNIQYNTIISRATGLLLSAIFAITAASQSRPVPLITDYNSIRVNQFEQNQGWYGVLAEYLIDRNPTTVYHSNYTYRDTGHPHAQPEEPLEYPTWIEARLDQPTDQSKTLYIYTQARAGSNNGHPTEFRIAGSHDGVNWTDNLATVEIGFSGEIKSPGEENFSEGFHLPSGYQWLRFICTRNYRGDNSIGGFPLLILAEFQLYSSDTNLTDLNTSPQAWMADQSHTIFDYNDYYKDFTLRHTRGVVNEKNHNVKGLSDWCDWSKWVDGTWTEAEELKKQGIEMPDFTYINKETAPWGRVTEGNRQRTHVTEHTVYAIPGQVTTLYPFSDIHNTTAYHENFVRWYDYPTDGNNPYLDFLHNPKMIARTDKMGFLGSTYMASGSTDKYDIYIHTVDDYKELINRVNNGETRIRAKQCADLYFNGRDDILPIGWSYDKPFRGIYDGGGFAIYGLVIDKPDWGEVGMFGHVGSAIIRYLHIDQSCRFSGKEHVGLIGAIDAPEYESTAKGTINTGGLLVHNLSTYATVTASGKNAGGIVGCNKRWESQFQVMILNCAVLGPVSGANESGSISGWIGLRATIFNCYNYGSISGVESKEKSFCRGTVCLYGNNFDNNEGNGLSRLPYSITDNNLANAMGNTEWEMSGWGTVLPNVRHDTSRFGGHERGVYASFYCPADRNFDTQYIAADFSQTFKNHVHVDYNGKTITEPVIAFRHIFTVINAKDLAEQVSGSEAANARYVSENRRTVRARAGADFQIRFEHPQPVDQATRTTMFYKDPQGVVRRVRKSKIKAVDRDGNDRSNIFYQSESYLRPGARQPIYGDKLDFYDESKWYERMMRCDAANASGRFTVHLVGCDENGNELKIFGSDKELILAEYVINFVDEQGAVMTTEAEMKTDRYAHTRPATLHEKYGEPIAVVNFDEYMALDKLANRNDYIKDLNNIPGGTGKSRMYKWPVPWENSQYAFGFDQRQDYNMYMLADHSIATPYHEAADYGTQAENFNKGTGRFDRLFYETEGAERGFFYYANAASDPGVTAKLDLSGLCPGSTLYVSAWLCEFSKASESQNIIFNFNAVKKDGSEVTLHSFVTGYVPEQGKWMHVFYQFTPNLSQLNLTSEDIHSYKLVLENNCKSSVGADYAIDDIRVYAAKPRVYAFQTMPLCRAEEGTDVRVETPFEVMLATLGASDASTSTEGSQIDCFYTFIDKDEYEAAIEAGDSGEDAFNKAVVRYQYMDNDDSKTQTFGRVTFNTHFRSNKQYVEGNKEVGAEAFRTEIEGERYLVINTRPQDKDLVAGKEYIVALYLNEPDDTGEVLSPGASQFDIASPCSKSSVFRIHASGVVKVDGIAVPDLDNIQVCENQTPVVQVDVQAIDENGELVDMVESAVHDWWVGDMASYIDQKDDVTGLPLYSIINTFRKEYPDAETWEMEPKGDYTEAMIEYIGSLASTPEDDSQPQPRLLINRSSFIFPPLKLAENQDTTEMAAVAIPIDRVTHDKYMICLHPQEVRLTVRNNSPELDHGFSGIAYPARIMDIPLRVGLQQLRGVTTISITDDSAPMGELIVPVRRVKVVSEGVTALERIPEDPFVYLAGTDDPQYLDLNVIKDPAGSPMGLKPIGRISEIRALENGSSANNLFRIAFDNAFRFKEGHTYRLRFSFRENGVSSLPTGDDGEGPVRHCHGQHVLTLKVVPEYQMWVGKDGESNWSNDKNWRRVSTSELLHPATEGDSDYDDFVTNRDDLASTTNSFVPMSFTKVIIPSGASVPMLYDSPTADVVAGAVYKWPENLDAPDGTGNPTIDIQYDMASENVTSSRNIICRPWYTNTCDQIHLHSNAEITGQHLLSHNRAWVDFEIEPAVWYTLSSPITGVVAGDMYLPTVGARQTTELFKPIKFDPGRNDRFAPAVYQRAWNAATAKVYELGGGADGRNVAVRTTWSNVYNDVTTDYSQPGTGFSIKADVSKAVLDKDADNNDMDIDHVMFRLPKDDDKFVYFDHNSNQTGHETQIARSAAKLHAGNNGDVAVTVSGVDQSKYFLVGNPFMAHLDMARFLQDNADVINGKYWVMNSEGQGAAILDGDVFSEAGTLENPELVPPMQGFFVEAKNAAKNLTLSFKVTNTVGVVHAPTDGNFLRTPALRGESADTRAAFSPAMRISAVKEGRTVSQAALLMDQRFSPGYDEEEDMALLIDSHQDKLSHVYTIAGNMAVSVNSFDQLISTEVGVAAPDGERTLIRFEGVDAIGDAMLHDVVENVTIPITEGMEYIVEGSVSGRLFIKGIATEVLASDAIRLGIDGREVTVTAPANGCPLAVKVYDSLGRLALIRDTDENTLRFTLEPGIYVVDARTQGVEPFTRKIMVK